jgi:hypothetical protein
MAGRKPNPSRASAIAAGINTYEGKPCRNCNTTLKYVNGSSCVECASPRKEGQQRTPLKNPKPFDPVAYQLREDRKDKQRGRLRRLYGITPEDYYQMLQEQNHTCAICGVHQSDLKSTATGRDVFRIDHCHNTGKVRGLLCDSCNVGLGHMKENVDFLNNMIDYIIKHNGSGPG